MNTNRANASTPFHKVLKQLTLQPVQIPNDPDQGLTVQQAASIWGCSYNEFRQLLRDGVIDSYPVRPGSTHRRVTRRAIEEARIRLRVNITDHQPVTSDTGVSDIDGQTFFDSLFGRKKTANII